MELNFPAILDGATGTALQRMGMPTGVCTEQWILDNPSVIMDLQRAYVNSGSSIIYAPTFGANRAKLESHGIFGRTAEYNTRLIALSKEAAAGKAFVAGDMSPTGQFMYPLGDTTFEELYEIYIEQATALEHAGADLFVIETMIGIPEARAALLAVKSISKKPVFVTFTCSDNGRTVTGADMLSALLIMQGMGADAFGLNCSSGPVEMLAQFRRLIPYARIPLIAKPNAGIPQMVDGQAAYNCAPEEFASSMKELSKLGVSIFGGCCGSTPEHIQALTNALNGADHRSALGSYGGQLPCATEKQACFLPADAEYQQLFPCDDSLEDALTELTEEDGLIAINIRSESELDILADCQYMIPGPLCLVCEDAGLLEQALRIYQGRALYDGGLSQAELLPLTKKYGLII